MLSKEMKELIYWQVEMEVMGNYRKAKDKAMDRA